MVARSALGSTKTSVAPTRFSLKLQISNFSRRLLVKRSWIYNPDMPIIEIKNLSKTYKVYQKQEGLMASVRGLFHRKHREVHAVSDINLTVEEGEFVAFLGPNGAGKTTTLKLLSGVINPDSGSATVLGHVPWERENEYRRKNRSLKKREIPFAKCST